VDSCLVVDSCPISVKPLTQPATARPYHYNQATHRDIVHPPRIPTIRVKL
jgi:hypothetical protein